MSHLYGCVNYGKDIDINRKECSLCYNKVFDYSKRISTATLFLNKYIIVYSEASSKGRKIMDMGFATKYWLENHIEELKLMYQFYQEYNDYLQALHSRFFKIMPKLQKIVCMSIVNQLENFENDAIDEFINKDESEFKDFVESYETFFEATEILEKIEIGVGIVEEYVHDVVEITERIEQNKSMNDILDTISEISSTDILDTFEEELPTFV